MKPLDDFSNNKSKRDGKASNCKACQYAANDAWVAKRPELAKLSTKMWINSNRERFAEKTKAWRDQRRSALSQYSVEYARKNKARTNARNARRRAAQTLASLNALDNVDVQMWYEVAEVLSRSGVKFQVDHVIPLVNTSVCGLHVSWNMTVIPAWENARKGNRWYVDE
jgi:hypothetical protein